MKTFAITTLGCKVNTYESEGYINDLIQNGLKQIDFKEKADVYIINTCAVTNTAASKSRQKIHQAQRLNENAIICVVGCLVQTTAADLGVDILIGSSGKKALAQHILTALNKRQKMNFVEDVSKYHEFENLNVASFSDHTRAFLKIQDGCNQFCSYCIIPYARGRERSLPLDDTLEATKQLIASGHKEIVLSGIHTGRYGHDIECDLSTLLKAMVAIDGILRIRISSIEMNEISDELLLLMKNNKKIARHLHIPIQSGCNRTLKMMNRPYTKEAFQAKVKQIRSILPDISISTDIILGFPDESEEDFKETYDTVEKIDFSFMHIFPFSKRDGTKACEIKNHLNNAEKKKRCQAISLLSQKHYNEYKQKFIGKEVDVLFEYEKDGYLFGHTSEYIPVLASLDKQYINTMQTVTISSLKDDFLLSE